MIKCKCGGNMVRRSIDALKDAWKIRYRCNWCQQWHSEYHDQYPEPPDKRHHGKNGRPGYVEIR